MVSFDQVTPSAKVRVSTPFASVAKASTIVRLSSGEVANEITTVSLPRYRRSTFASVAAKSTKRTVSMLPPAVDRSSTVSAPLPRAKV